VTNQKVQRHDEASVRAQVRDHIVSSWLSGDDRGLDDTTDLQEAGVLDSFGILTLFGFLEQKFGVQLDPGDINPENFRSMDSIAKLVIAKSAGKDEDADS
jgi:acyl carrier protein